MVRNLVVLLLGALIVGGCPQSGSNNTPASATDIISGSVGPDAGKMETPSDASVGHVSVQWDAGTFPSGASLKIRAVAQLPDLPPGNLQPVGKPFEIIASQQPGKPVTVSFGYPTGAQALSTVLIMHRSDDGQWSPLGTVSADESTGTITVVTPAFSIFSGFGYTPLPTIDTGFTLQDMPVAENQVSTAHPEGNCLGCASFTSWYFWKRKLGQSPKAGIDALTSASRLSFNGDGGIFDQSQSAAGGFIDTAIDNFLAVLGGLGPWVDLNRNAMLWTLEQTGTPQVVAFRDSSNGIWSFHAVLVVGYQNGQMKIYDPNKRLAFDSLGWSASSGLTSPVVAYNGDTCDLPYWLEEAGDAKFDATFSQIATSKLSPDLAPTIAATPPSDLQAGATWSSPSAYDVATDGDDDNLSLSWAQLSGPAVANTSKAPSLFTFTAPSVSAVTDVVLQLTARDDYGVSGVTRQTASQNFTIHVQPSSTSGGQNSGGEGSTGAGGWTQRSPATSPSARSFATMAYDSVRGVTVLFGGYNAGSLADTWEWNGTNWTQRSPSTSPSARYSATMAYDSTRRVAVLFGGNNGSSYLGDTWEWDGTNWMQRSPSSSPPADSDWNPMAYDRARDVTVLFGGTAYNYFLGTTWEWNGTNWAERSQGVGSEPWERHGAALAYDSTRSVTVLYGGLVEGDFADTWEYDGINWTPRFPSTAPPAREYASMAYDSARGAAVLFGGASYVDMGQGSVSTTYFGDTWEWNGTNWIQNSPVTSPTGRISHAMAFDSTRGVTVVFGGYNGGGCLGDTWELGN